MKIQIDGVSTINKGAELMLNSVLEQIELNYPDSTVILNSRALNIKKINTKLKIKIPFHLKYSRYIAAILNRLNTSNIYFTTLYPLNNINLVLDASGFAYGDQWNHTSNSYRKLEKYYKHLKKNKTKIVLLPQSFGPFENPSSKDLINVLNNYVDIIISREKISSDYLINSGINQDKLFQYPDFTVTSKGLSTEKYESLKGGICIIPNSKMITHGKNAINDYLYFYKIIIDEFKSKYNMFLLNHEGKGDFDFCKKINDKFNFELPIVTNLNAREIKGVIKESKLVISSRFHGVASALNQSVPCLSTSWSHKYEELLKYYDLEDSVLNINAESDVIINIINNLLIPENQKNSVINLVIRQTR